MESPLAAAHMKPHSVEVGKTVVTYYDSVDRVDDRPAIVLVHGTGGSTVTHYSFLFPMLAADQRVIAIDLTAPASDQLEASDLVDQVAAVVRQVRVPEVLLVGYSLGAVVAAATAAQHPDLIAGLVLIAGWIRTDTQQRVRNEIWRKLRRLDPQTAREFSVFTAYSSTFLELRTADEVKQLIDAVSFDEFKDQQMELNRRIDITDLMTDIRARTLVLGCRDDFMVPARHSRAMFGAIANACYVEITSGHAVVRERPAELVHWISTFNAYPDRFPVGAILPNIRP